jgi:SAM-dependent methyltransferase
MLRENSYGDAKRWAFVDTVVRARRPRNVLDVGCGSGDLLTAPLAAAYPDVEVVGVDADADSLAHATTRHGRANLCFLPFNQLPGERRFDLVIASEVIEHVDAPDAFLCELRARVADGGAIILTLPNGYGPAELGATVEALLQVSGAYRILRAIWRALGLKRAAGMQEAPDVVSSLAVSPHVNFFGFHTIRSLLAGAGFTVEVYRPRTFLCGFGFDHVIALCRAIDWNARVADRLPPALVSDWMFLAVPVREAAGAGYRRGAWARFRAALNRRRWGLA